MGPGRGVALLLASLAIAIPGAMAQVGPPPCSGPILDTTEPYVVRVLQGGTFQVEAILRMPDTTARGLRWHMVLDPPRLGTPVRLAIEGPATLPAGDRVVAPLRVDLAGQVLGTNGHHGIVLHVEGERSPCGGAWEPLAKEMFGGGSVQVCDPPGRAQVRTSDLTANDHWLGRYNYTFWGFEVREARWTAQVYHRDGPPEGFRNPDDDTAPWRIPATPPVLEAPIAGPSTVPADHEVEVSWDVVLPVDRGGSLLPVVRFQADARVRCDGEALGPWGPYEDITATGASMIRRLPMPGAEALVLLLLAAAGCRASWRR